MEKTIKIYRSINKYFTHRVLVWDEDDKSKSFLIEMDFTTNPVLIKDWKYTNQNEIPEIESFKDVDSGWIELTGEKKEISRDIEGDIDIDLESRLK